MLSTLCYVLLSDKLISFLNVILQTSEILVGFEVTNSTTDTPWFFQMRTITNYKVKFTKGEFSKEGNELMKSVSPTFLLSYFLHVFKHVILSEVVKCDVIHCYFPISGKDERSYYLPLSGFIITLY